MFIICPNIFYALDKMQVLVEYIISNTFFMTKLNYSMPISSFFNNKIIN